MKKIFSKKIDTLASRETSSYVGKVFTLSQISVTVEETLAEGMLYVILH